MSDLTPIAPSSTLTVVPIAQARDLLQVPAPSPAPADDPFGPAVVVTLSQPQPAFVIYDASGRLTASLPADAGVVAMPPARIDAGDPDAPRNLVYLA